MLVLRDKAIDLLHCLSTSLTRSVDEITKLKSERDKLQKKVFGLTSEVKELKKDYNILRKQYTDSEETLAAGQMKVNGLTSEVNKLRKDYNVVRKQCADTEEASAAGRMTWLFEQHVARIVLPDEVPLGEYDQLKQMKEWLKEKETRQRASSNDLWNKLQQQFDCHSFSHRHKKTLKTLRSCRNPVVHPPKINLRKLRQDIGKKIPHLTSCNVSQVNFQTAFNIFLSAN